ncbi:MAG: 50S ribosomal protein L18 [Chloroflexi bacterium]|nr:50S ribosomal protein L18 [Chloroflexota bacterium]MBI4198162.1 50S ribosomal protein L18 [Chloroflexota bacterium]
MARLNTKGERRRSRHLRVRKRVEGTTTRPRLSVFRSIKEIYAQVIDDGAGRTLAAATSLKLPKAEGDAKATKTDEARLVGAEIARKATEAGVHQVVFDRGGNRYHGRVKALAEAARKGGLEF